jgi:hypothetical protein
MKRLKPWQWVPAELRCERCGAPATKAISGPRSRWFVQPRKLTGLRAHRMDDAVRIKIMDDSEELFERPPVLACDAHGHELQGEITDNYGSSGSVPLKDTWASLGWRVAYMPMRGLRALVRGWDSLRRR